MEIVLIILSALLLTALVISFVIMSFAVSHAKAAKLRLNELTESVFDYNIEWTEDFSELKFGNNLKKLLQNCGITPDEKYVQSVFGDKPGGTDGAISLCVNALRKSGVISEYISSNGSSGLIHWKSFASTLSDGRIKIFSLGRDISDDAVSKKNTERLRQQLSDEFNYMKTAASNADAGIFSLFCEGETVYVKTDGRICAQLGFENTDTILLDQFFSLIKKEELMDAQYQLKRFITGITESLYLKISIKTVLGVYHNFVIECRYNVGVVDYHHVRTGMIFDVTAAGIFGAGDSYKDGQRDNITGLYNRNGFMMEGAEYLKTNADKGGKLVLLCIQAVRLRKISMLFGMEIADTLAKIYAEALTKTAGDNSVVGKVGVEDFAVLLPCNRNDEDGVEGFAKKVSIVVESYCNNDTLPTVLKDQSGFIAGACFFDGMDDISTLYNKASVTLFSGVRKPGKICCFFDEKIERAVSGRDIVEHEIGEALRLGELEVYYQPKMSLKTGKIIGAEALMRWNHKTQGLIMPSEFIQIAEEMGIITKIDEWGMLQACIQNKMWQDKGFEPIKISVNMSQAQLYQTDVVTSVKNVLNESGIDPACLEVELTETMAMIDIDKTINVLNALKKLGVSISMDDFGTGYSSLSSLKILPIDLLKIDRSLVYDIETNTTARRITKAIVDLGKAMNLTLLAEGVETVGQRDMLAELGCDIIQGYLYSKPQPAAVIERNFLVPTAAKQLVLGE